VTDELASDMTRSRKAATTVALDYGLMRLSGGERIHLFGTPGQERFDFMWGILTNGGIGLVLLLNNTRPDPFKDLEFFLAAFDDFIRETQVAVGITRMDLDRRPGLRIISVNWLTRALRYRCSTWMPGRRPMSPCWWRHCCSLWTQAWLRETGCHWC